MTHSDQNNPEWREEWRTAGVRSARPMRSTFLDAHQGAVYVYPGTGPKGGPAITLDTTAAPNLVTLPAYAVLELRDACNAYLREHWPEKL